MQLKKALKDDKAGQIKLTYIIEGVYKNQNLYGKSVLSMKDYMLNILEYLGKYSFDEIENAFNLCIEEIKSVPVVAELLQAIKKNQTVSYSPEIQTTRDYLKDLDEENKKIEQERNSPKGKEFDKIMDRYFKNLKLLGVEESTKIFEYEKKELDNKFK